jgi:hypothetical protein
MSDLFISAAALAAAAMIVLGEYSPTTKGLALGLAVGSLAMQYVPSIQEEIHYLVPLFMQLVLVGWWWLATRLE